MSSKPMNNIVPVTDDDRKAALKINYDRSPCWLTGVPKGEYDGHGVLQTFAKHRLAHSQPEEKIGSKPFEITPEQAYAIVQDYQFADNSGCAEEAEGLADLIAALEAYATEAGACPAPRKPRRNLEDVEVIDIFADQPTERSSGSDQ